MKIVRAIRYFLIELLYTGIMLYFFNYMQMTYSVDTIFDHSLFMILCLGLIVLIWFIGPMLNRYFVLIYSAIYSLYLVSQDIYKRAFHQYYRFSTVQDLLKEALGVKESTMEFKVTSTKLYLHPDTQPCEEAFFSGKDKNKPWAVKITSLKGLLEFVEKYGDVIIGEDSDGKLALEIYDDYRE